MNLVGISAKNVLRNRFRTFATIVGVALALIIFMLLRTVLDAWDVAANHASRDRLAVRNKMSWVVPVPRKYVQQIQDRHGDEIAAITWANWFGGNYAREEREFFANIAIDAKSSLQVYDEIHLPEDQKQAWFEDKQGAIVGDVLAKKFGWKIGDRVTLIGTIYPRDENWEFTIRGIYTATRRSVDRSQFLFHWEYLNDWLPAAFQDQAGWLVVRAKDPSRSAELAKAIDTMYEDADVQTLSQSELELQRSFMATFAAVLTAIDVVSAVILVILMLILGNTIAMGVRERTNEYGVLRAIGFLPRHLAQFVIGEAATIGLCGGALGLGLGYPFVNYGFGRWLEENMGAFFPYFRVQPGTAVAAFVLALVLGLVAAALPAYRASRLVVTDALRRVG